MTWSAAVHRMAGQGTFGPDDDNLSSSFVFAGAAGTDPAMIVVSLLLILAWRSAGWCGVDRWLLPRCGCRCELAVRQEPRIEAVVP